MKRFYSILSVAILVWTPFLSAKAAVEVSVDFFHDSLEPYGDWREVGDYGYCWQPRDVEENWRPYSDGHWLYTDAGWTWDSEEPYSWAVYHYGRWARVDRVGWVWVPGTEWGPAWVSWRRSPRHVGWAPLPPEAQFSRSVGFSARVDADYDIGPTNYNFVEVRNFGAPRLRSVFVEPRENITIITQTTNITRITYVNNVVYNEGPQYDVISRESAQPIRRLKLERREEFDGDTRPERAEQLRTRVEGDSLRVVAIPFDAKPATAPRKIAPKVEKVEVDRGWKNAGPAPAVAKLRTKMKSEPATPAEPPPQPKTEKTAEAPAATHDAPGEPAKGNVQNGGLPAGSSPEKPVTPDQPPKPGKQAGGPKPLRPEAGKLRPTPPADEKVVPPAQPKKARSNETETPRPPEKALPKEHVQERKPKTENVVPTHPVRPAVVEPAPQNIRPGKEDMPKPEPQANKPQPHQQSAPAITQPQPHPAKTHGKDKAKDEKKDAAKPDGTPQ